MRIDYYMAEWKCSDGKIISNPDGSLQNEDKKYFKESKIKPISYYCEGGGKLNGRKCEITETEDAQKERTCPSGYTSIYDDHICINYNKTANKESGFVCKGGNTKLKGNICIIYEAFEAKK